METMIGTKREVNSAQNLVSWQSLINPDSYTLGQVYDCHVELTPEQSRWIQEHLKANYTRDLEPNWVKKFVNLYETHTFDPECDYLSLGYIAEKHKLVLLNGNHRSYAHSKTDESQIFWIRIETFANENELNRRYASFDGPENARRRTNNQRAHMLDLFPNLEAKFFKKIPQWTTQSLMPYNVVLKHIPTGADDLQWFADNYEPQVTKLIEVYRESRGAGTRKNFIFNHPPLVVICLDILKYGGEKGLWFIEELFSDNNSNCVVTAMGEYIPQYTEKINRFIKKYENLEIKTGNRSNVKQRHPMKALELTWRYYCQNRKDISRLTISEEIYTSDFDFNLFPKERLNSANKNLSINSEIKKSVEQVSKQLGNSSRKTICKYVIHKLDKETPHSLHDDFRFINPYGFDLLGKSIKDLDMTWSALYKEFLNVLCKKDPMYFASLPENIKFPYMFTFSENNKFRTAKRINDTMFAEDNFSANDRRNRMKLLLDDFGIDISEMVIYLREKKEKSRKIN